MLKILNKLPEKSSLFETILVSTNDKLVKSFLDDKIKFTDIYRKMNTILDLNEFKKFKKLKVKKIDDIINASNKVDDKLNSEIN